MHHDIHDHHYIQVAKNQQGTIMIIIIHISYVYVYINYFSSAKVNTDLYFLHPLLLPFLALAEGATFLIG